MNTLKGKKNALVSPGSLSRGAQAGAEWLTGFILNSDQNLKMHIVTVRVALLINLIYLPSFLNYFKRIPSMRKKQLQVKLLHLIRACQPAGCRFVQTLKNRKLRKRNTKDICNVLFQMPSGSFTHYTFVLWPDETTINQYKVGPISCILWPFLDL